MYDNILYLSRNLVKSTSQTPHEEQSPPVISFQSARKDFINVQ